MASSWQSKWCSTMRDEDFVRLRLENLKDFQALVVEHEEEQMQRDANFHPHVATVMASRKTVALQPKET
eukprot:5066966-Amphidinium_carterae.1